MLNADDDGVVEAFPVVRMIGSQEDSLGLLVIKQFIKPLNEEMVYFVVDFNAQNTVRKDRYTPSKYAELITNPVIGLPNGNQMATNGKPSGNPDKNRLDKNRLDKNNNISDKSDSLKDLSERFETLWKLYPNKKGKPKAFTAYKKAIKDGVTDDEISVGIEKYLQEIKIKKTEKQYIKHGSTWFNNCSWSDDYEIEQSQTVAGKVVPDWAKQPYKEPEYSEEEILDEFK
jgi:hypothetical protein